MSYQEENNMACVIMAGGVGTRFWPLSTYEKPKQFLCKKVTTAWQESSQMIELLS
ncbi:MAG: hypothetical protein JRJ79_17525 [Deltaproteobacteria bacterium]|nr:hypothetical protein [Deltaproteobacteria bacterium]